MISDKEWDKIIEILFDSYRHTYHNEFEPYDLYSKKMQSKMLKDSNKFKERFLRGYHLLEDSHEI